MFTETEVTTSQDKEFFMVLNQGSYIHFMILLIFELICILAISRIYKIMKIY
jgi:hypothetical protein